MPSPTAPCTSGSAIPSASPHTTQPPLPQAPSPIRGALASRPPLHLPSHPTAPKSSPSTPQAPTGPTQSATVTIVVHSANFGPAHLVQIGTPRTWTPPSLDVSHLVEADERLVFTETTTGGARKFLVGTSEAVNRHTIARLPENINGAPSAILARGTVHCFDVITVSQTRDASIVTQYPDGTWLMKSTLVAVNLPPGIIVRLRAVNQGTLFTNGSTTLNLRAGDFDINGIATVYYEWSGTGSPKMCHRTQLFTDN
jgi:hypothetical protein